MVSIVVPVYNIEQYLHECLDSLAAQTWKDVEIILVDDGSKDKSGDICDVYAKKDRRFRVVHKENGGVSSARNAGILAASGEYLVFVDGDDFIHPKMLEAYMAMADSGKNLLCEYTSDRCRWESLSGDEWREGKEERDYEDFMALFYRDYIHAPFNKLYKMSIVKEHQIFFPPDTDLGEDLLFNLEYFTWSQGEYQILRCPFYFYRESREGSLSTGYRNDLFELQQKLFWAVQKFLKNTGIWTEKNQKIFWGMYFDRLYLTIQMCRAYERVHQKEKRLSQLLKDPVWKGVWEQCRRKKILNWKRKLKKVLLKYYGMVSR